MTAFIGSLWRAFSSLQAGSCFPLDFPARLPAVRSADPQRTPPNYRMDLLRSAALREEEEQMADWEWEYLRRRLGGGLCRRQIERAIWYRQEVQMPIEGIAKALAYFYGV